MSDRKKLGLSVPRRTGRGIVFLGLAIVSSAKYAQFLMWSIQHWRKAIEWLLQPYQSCCYCGKRRGKDWKDTSWNINKRIETVHLPKLPIIFLCGLAITKCVCCLI